MKIIKKLNDKKIKLDDTVYKPYNLGNLPPTFAFKYSEDKGGIYQWFNYKGLTYIKA